MRIASRATRLAAQISLLVALLSTGVFVMLRSYLDDDERLFGEGRINQVVSKGPVTVGKVDWQLDSLQAYNALVDDKGEKISLDQPAGSVIILATLTVTPRPGVRLKDHGFSCAAVLRDDRGNVWQSQQAFGFALPTYCTDDDHPFDLDKPGKLAQIYVVPASAVPHLTGVVVENLDERNRILITLAQ
ncbi:MAG TPA: hypothetical protein VFI00_23010 [Kribbella sp.]|nr:hypothetical protein [Kribbella sp.]